MRQKIFFLILFIFSIAQLFPHAQAYAIALAPPIKTIFPPIRNVNQTFLGEDQYYTVTFRGNGEAVVTMKAILTNTSNAPLSSIALHLPSNTVANDVTAYQVIAQPQCIQYSNDLLSQSKCLQYQPPDFRYVSDDTSYKKIAIQQKDDTLTFTLPNTLNSNDTGSYILSYRTFTNTHKNLFGAYNFVFNTIKVDDPINTLQIGINTDSDLYLKNATGTVQYNSSISMGAMPKTADSNIQNSQFNNLYNQIGEGVITKTVTNLAPMETYSVNGMYADAGIKLYGREITITIGSVLLVLLLIFGTAVFVLKKKRNTIKEEKKTDEKMKLFFIAAGISFVSVLLASGYTIGILLLSLFINTSNYFLETNYLFLFLLVSALSGAVYLFLLFVPTIIMTIKKGFVWGGITFGLTMMWSVISLIILLGIIFLFYANNNTPIRPFIQPLPMMGGVKANSVAPVLKGL